MTSTARSVAAGSAWTYGAQLVSMALQLAYAAVTSRIVGAESFGIYSVAVLVANLVAILSAAGLGQSIARSLHEPEKTIRGLASVAAGYGLIAAVFIAPLSHFWASLWGNTEAALSIQLVGLSAALAPSVGLLSGFLRRQRKFRVLAVSTAASTALALLVSGLLVWIFRTPEALISAPVLTQLFTYVAYQTACRGTAFPGRVSRNVLHHLSFGWRVSVANLLAYGIENVGRFAVSRAVGQTSLGLWNRADVVTTGPFDRLQAAMSQALYPELARAQEDSGRQRRVWTDVLVVVAWISLPASAFLAGAVPSLIPLLLGPDWDAVVPICMVLALAAGFRGSSIQLASALEAAGYFKWIWVTHAFLLSIQIGCAAAVFLWLQPFPAILGMLIIPIARHILQGWLCSRRAILDGKRLISNYGHIILASGLCGAFSFGVSVLAIEIKAGVLASGALFGLAAAMVLIGAYVLRKKLSVWDIASRYGFAK
ncbi:O-antigen/teichoic acid export membrane protein [Arthrobacter sp. AG367]|uniref:oligosaccharide flippase family protein n=1 Tax=Arthrobacter sp. AG367 TaxID=2572909 RepID=UPI0011A95A70|nr:oligosaccharide flippase family protein [Arthrobacter sp. AG367]TWD48164.1 O-antigen/teichoic acid export membrane protein [Arthrobacter sp. AG367]